LQTFLDKMERKKSKVSKQQPADEVNLKERLEILSRAQEIEKKVDLNLSTIMCRQSAVLTSCFQVEDFTKRKDDLASQFSGADKALKEFEHEVAECKSSHADIAQHLADAKRLERSVASWGLGELDRLKRQIDEDKGDDTALEDCADRDQIEKDLDKLEAKIGAKRKEMQSLRDKLESQKNHSDKLLGEFYGYQKFLHCFQILGIICHKWNNFCYSDHFSTSALTVFL
jgi:hypothetical protein